MSGTYYDNTLVDRDTDGTANQENEPIAIPRDVELILYHNGGGPHSRLRLGQGTDIDSRALPAYFFRYTGTRGNEQSVGPWGSIIEASLMVPDTGKYELENPEQYTPTDLEDLEKLYDLFRIFDCTSEITNLLDVGTQSDFTYINIYTIFNVDEEDRIEYAARDPIEELPSVQRGYNRRW